MIFGCLWKWSVYPAQYAIFWGENDDESLDESMDGHPTSQIQLDTPTKQHLFWSPDSQI
jgi:hypothetical protein